MTMKKILGLWLVLGLIGNWACRPRDEVVPGQAVSESFFLRHAGADMPVVVEGNTASGVFIVVLHGGPGGNAMIYNTALTAFSDPLEADYAMVYWDQRSSGSAKGAYGLDRMEVAAYIEDLDRLMTLLRHRYGADSRFFLLGHSWGGMLSCGYLADSSRAAGIAGWINIAGAHSFPLIRQSAPPMLIATGEGQIAADQEAEAWQEIVDYCRELGSGGAVSLEETAQVNRYGYEAELLLTKAEVLGAGDIPLGDLWRFYFGTSHNLVTAFFNQLLTSAVMVPEVVETSFSEVLPGLNMPTLLIWGRYDHVVPLALGEEVHARLGTPEADKTLLVMEASGHSPMITEPAETQAAIRRFVATYR